MTPRATEFTEEILIPPGQAVDRYGPAVAEMMDRVARSSSSEVQKLTSGDMRWYLGYLRGQDPATSDEEEFVEELKRTTVVKVVARSGGNAGRRFRHEVTWEGPMPRQVIAKLEARARMICTHRQKAAEQAAEEPTELEPIEDQKELIRQLDQWIKDHPRHDKRLAYVCHVALENLIESGA